MQATRALRDFFPHDKQLLVSIQDVWRLYQLAGGSIDELLEEGSEKNPMLEYAHHWLRERLERVVVQLSDTYDDETCTQRVEGALDAYRELYARSDHCHSPWVVAHLVYKNFLNYSGIVQLRQADDALHVLEKKSCSRAQVH